MRDKGRRTLRILPLPLLLLGLAARVLAQQPAANSLQQVDFYAQREKTAPAHIRSLLAQLRQQIKDKKLSFEVGYTTALDKKLEVLAGTRLPKDLPALAARQNELAKALIAIDTATRDSFDRVHPNLLPELILRRKFPKPCSLQRAFDWRKAGKVTPVRDQDGCGSCWDFSALGAYEGSYLMRNSVVIDAAEQQVLSCSGAGSCGGGWPATVFVYLINHGTSAEASYPYTATDSRCNTAVATPYRAVAWAFVEPSGGIPSVQAMKDALCRYGPLSVTVFVDSPFQAYRSGVFNSMPSSSTPGINHAITLIGWDDAKHAWLIKNSWGTGWGETGGYGTERGYMWIDYNSNNVGMAAAWVQAQSRFYALGPEYFKLLPHVPPMPRPLTPKPSL